MLKRNLNHKMQIILLGNKKDNVIWIRMATHNHINHVMTHDTTTYTPKQVCRYQP